MVKFSYIYKFSYIFPIYYIIYIIYIYITLFQLFISLGCGFVIAISTKMQNFSNPHFPSVAMLFANIYAEI